MTPVSTRRRKPPERPTAEPAVPVPVPVPVPAPVGAAVPERAPSTVAWAAGVAGVTAAWAAGVAGVTAAWVVTTVAGGDVPLLVTDARGTAAAAATAALTGVGWRPRGRRSAALCAAGLALLPLAVAAAAGGWRLPQGDVSAAVLGVLGGSLLVVVATLGPLRARPLAGPGLVLGILSAPALPPLVLTAVGVVAAVAWVLCWPRQPSPALAALAMAAASLPVGGQSSGLLAAAAALALIARHPTTALLALPGTAALAASVVTTDPEAPLVLLLAGSAVAAVVLAARAGLERGGGQHAPETLTVEAWLPLVPAAGLALWLLLGPGSWRWAGAAGPGAYDRGAGVAAAAGALALVGPRLVEMVRTR